MINKAKKNSDTRLINSVSPADSRQTIRRVCSALLVTCTDEDPLEMDLILSEQISKAHIIEAWQDPIEGFIVLVEDRRDMDGIPVTHELDSLEKEDMIDFANMLLKIKGSVVLSGKDEEEEEDE